MKKEIINAGFTNKKKYREDNKFVLFKNYTGFNHHLDYKILHEFNFVPKLINDNKDKQEWEFIEGQTLTNPSDEDLKKVGAILRTIHKSDLKFPKNNLRKRVINYLKILHQKKLFIPEIENNYKEMSKLISRMNHINPCHNDIWDQNIIKSKNKIYLVDWEYATMGDKHFDLAYYIMSQNLNQQQEKILLESYNSFDDYNAYIKEWMPKYKKFVVWLTILWANAQEKIPFNLTKLKQYLKNNNN